MSVSNWTFWLGIVKAPFFAAAIAVVGCRRGLSVERSAESVGRLHHPLRGRIDLSGDRHRCRVLHPLCPTPYLIGPTAPIIRVRGLVTRLGGRVLHDNLDLDVHRGEVLGVVGGSGAGKSVLLRTIIGLMRPAAGTIEVFGEDLLTQSEARRRADRGALGRAVPGRRAVLLDDGGAEHRRPAA